MSLPSPTESEKQGEFVARCVIDPKVIEEFDEMDQRLAVCFDQFQGSQNNVDDPTGACCSACASGGPCDGGADKDKPEGNQKKGLLPFLKGLINNTEDKEQIQLVGNMSGLVTQGSFQGQDHLVVPVIMAIGNTVMNGIYYPAEELAKFPDAWNGIPLPVHHPKKNGKDISANDPKVIEEWSIGTLFNVRFEDNKLKGDAWINTAKCQDKAPEILNLLERNKDIEVSTGLFLEQEIQSGEADGVPFQSVGVNYRPDHLAILPGAIGACSCEAGCGLPRINETLKGNDEEMNPEKRKALIETFEALNSQLFSNRNKSFSDIRNMLHDLIESNNQTSGNVWVMEVFTDPMEVVFEIWNQDEDAKIFKQGFMKDEQGKISLQGMPMEVEQVISFEPKNKLEAPTGASETKEEGKKDMDKETMINALIANTESSWGEDDKEFLNGLEEDHLKKILGPEANEEEGSDEGSDDSDGEGGDAEGAEGSDEGSEESPESNEGDDKKKMEDEDKEEDEEEDEEEKPEGNASKSVSVEDFLANSEDLPSEVVDVLQNSVNTNKETKTKLIQDILKIVGCTFTNEELEAKNADELEKVLKISGNVKKSGDYSGQAAPAPKANVGGNTTASVGSAPVLFGNKEKSEG